MAKESILEKAYIQATDNMSTSGVDKNAAFQTIKFEMVAYFSKHDANVTEAEIEEYIKVQTGELDEALSDYSMIQMDKRI